MSIFSQPSFLALETVLGIFLPIYLSYRYVVLSRLRWLIGVFQIAYISYVATILQLQFPQLTLPQQLTPFHLFLVFYTFLIILGIIYFAARRPRSFYLPQPMIYPQYNLLIPFILYALLSAPLQEIFFRSIYLPRISTVLSPSFSLLFSSFIFAIFHLQFKNKLLIIGSFASGIIWGSFYTISQDLFSITLSHALIGLTFSYYAHIITRRINHKNA